MADRDQIFRDWGADVRLIVVHTTYDPETGHAHECCESFDRVGVFTSIGRDATPHTARLHTQREVVLTLRSGDLPTGFSPGRGRVHFHDVLYDVIRTESHEHSGTVAVHCRQRRSPCPTSESPTAQ